MLSKLFPRSTQTPKPTGPTLSTNPTEPSPSPSADSETFRQAWAEINTALEEERQINRLIALIESEIFLLENLPKTTSNFYLEKSDMQIIISALKKL